MRFRTRVSLLLAVLVLLAGTFPGMAFAEEEQGAWWEQDYWPREVLEELGAVAPDYNAGMERYEISSPEQLLFLSGIWKTEDKNGDGAPDAPCNGTYVLTQDLDMAPLMERLGTVLSERAGKTVKGYMPPIAASADKDEEEGVHCAFFGVFDGQGHAIRNIRIEQKNEKYVGLIGNIGHDFGTASVKDLAILDAEIYGKASAGILTASIYGTVENVVCTGKVTVLEKTAGGLAGKIKRNDNGDLGTVRNCVVFADIEVLGQGGENGAAGLISGSNSKGGQIFNCFAGGSIRVDGKGADTVGGIVGNLKGGLAVDNCVMVGTGIAATGPDSSNFGLLCGSYAGDTGSHIHNNYVWEGTRLSGAMTSDHPETACFTVISAEQARDRVFYLENSGWDFDSAWTWVGEDGHGYPMLTAFAEAVDLGERLDSELRITEPVVQPSEPTVNSVYAGEETEIFVNVKMPDGIEAKGGTFLYGTEKDRATFANSLPMTAENGRVSLKLTFDEFGTYYYYCTVEAGGKTFSVPSEGSLRLDVVSASEKYQPMQETVSPGADFSSVGINWITTAEGLTGEVRYRKNGSSQWETTVPAETYTAQVGNDHGRFESFSADLTGLEPSASYDYMAVTRDGTDEYFGKVHTFTTLPDSENFSFIVISDLQGTSEDEYMPYLYTDASFLTETIHPDFVINCGDLTEDDTMAEWAYMFNTIGEVIASKLTAYVPGNHEFKGDMVYTHFKGRTNLPGGIDIDVLKETTSCFKVGDVCFVTINTDPHSGLDNADAAADKMMYYEAQKEWAKEMFEQSGCSRLILCGHAGLVQKDDAATAFLERMCGELGAALFFNGHIHDYFRATVNGEGQPAEIGEATTFVTTSPMGTKFDDYGHEIDDILQFQTGGSDDPRQYLTYVEVSGETITVTGYRRSSAAEATKNNCGEYEVIDQYVLEPKQIVEEPAEVQQKPEQPADQAAPQEPKKTGTSPVIWIVLGVIVIAAVVFFLIRRNRKKAD